MKFIQLTIVSTILLACLTVAFSFTSHKTTYTMHSLKRKYNAPLSNQNIRMCDNQMQNENSVTQRLKGLRSNTLRELSNMYKNSNIAVKLASIIQYQMKQILKNIMKTISILSMSFNMNGLPQRLANTKYAAIIASAMLLKPQSASAAIFSNHLKMAATKKLATTPVFFLSNSGGNPYLQEDVQAGRPSQRIVTYFLSSDDAYEYLNEMAQGNPSNVNEFRITVSTMEKVMNRIESRKQSRKLGRYDMSTVIRIQPSSLQTENANNIAGNGNTAAGIKKLKGVSIPMFTAEGLLIKRGSEIVVPYYFAYEDLLEDWEKVAETADTKAPKVVVKDFVEVMCSSEGITNDWLNELQSDEDSSSADNDDSDIEETASMKKEATIPVFVPPRREIESIRQYYRKDESGSTREYQRARLIGSRN